MTILASLEAFAKLAASCIRSQREVVVTESNQVIPGDSTLQEPSISPVKESGHDSKALQPVNPIALPAVAEIDDVMIQIARTGFDIRRRRN